MKLINFLNKYIKENKCLLLDKLAVVTNSKSYVSLENEQKDNCLTSKLKMTKFKNHVKATVAIPYDADIDIENLSAIELEQCVNECIYELNTALIHKLIENSKIIGTWNRNPSITSGESRIEHLTTFAEVVASLDMSMYQSTKRYVPSYYLVSADLIPVLRFNAGFEAKSENILIVGTYQCGTFNGIPVYCSPSLDNQIIAGLVSSDSLSASAFIKTNKKLLTKHKDGKIHYNLAIETENNIFSYTINNKLMNKEN